MEVQDKQRRTHAICLQLAARLFAKHAGGQINLKSDEFKKRIQLISSESDVNQAAVTSAFAKVLTEVALLPVRAARIELMIERGETKLTQDPGSIVKSELAVFKELCIELLNEYEPGKFTVYDKAFGMLVMDLATDLEFPPREVGLAMIEVYSSAERRHLEDVLDALLGEWAAQQKRPANDIAAKENPPEVNVVPIAAE